MPYHRVDRSRIREVIDRIERDGETVTHVCADPVEPVMHVFTITPRMSTQLTTRRGDYGQVRR